jgi:hypothetical protein
MDIIIKIFPDNPTAGVQSESKVNKPKLIYYFSVEHDNKVENLDALHRGVSCTGHYSFL